MEYNNTMKTWHNDIHEMHAKYGVHEWVEGEKDKDDWSRLGKFLEFRLKFLQEELDETRAAAIIDGNPAEVVDGLIDLCVVAIGTLDAFGVDAQKACSTHSRTPVSFGSDPLSGPGSRPVSGTQVLIWPAPGSGSLIWPGIWDLDPRS